MQTWILGNPTPLRPTYTVYRRPFGLDNVAEVYNEDDARRIAKLPEIESILEDLAMHVSTSFGPAADPEGRSAAYRRAPSTRAEGPHDVVRGSRPGVARDSARLVNSGFRKPQKFSHTPGVPS